MSTLTLVRHGQATAFEKTSDLLSGRGEEQARILGCWWAGRGVAFDEIYSGTLERQRRTAEIVRSQYANAGLDFPPIQSLDGLCEYDAPAIFQHLIPKLEAQDARFRELVATWRQNDGGPQHNRHFQRMFEVVIGLRAAGSIGAPGVETWPAFQQRVRRAVGGILAGAGNRRVAIFTSGGPIAVTTQMALHAPDETALSLHWRIRNTALTEFLFSRDRFTLDAFNTLPHLPDSALWTFR